MREHNKVTASWIVKIFFAGVLIISALTSFGFFFNFFDQLIPPDLPIIGGTPIAAAISGVVGVLMFDGATAVWLYAFLNTAETPKQRATSGAMSAFTFVGAAIASMAHMSLSATSLETFDPTTLGYISIGSLIIVIVAVIANFWGTMHFQKNTLENQLKIRQADRRDEVLKAEEEHQRHLDGLVRGKVKTFLDGKADEIAHLQATQIAQRFLDNEAKDYSDQKSPVTINGNGASPNGHHAPPQNGKRQPDTETPQYELWAEDKHGQPVQIMKGSIEKLNEALEWVAPPYQVIDSRGKIVKEVNRAGAEVDPVGSQTPNA